MALGRISPFSALEKQPETPIPGQSPQLGSTGGNVLSSVDRLKAGLQPVVTKLATTGARRGFSVLSDLLGSTPQSPESVQAMQEQRAGERADMSAALNQTPQEAQAPLDEQFPGETMGEPSSQAPGLGGSLGGPTGTTDVAGGGGGGFGGIDASTGAGWLGTLLQGLGAALGNQDIGKAGSALGSGLQLAQLGSSVGTGIGTAAGQGAATAAGEAAANAGLAVGDTAASTAGELAAGIGPQAVVLAPLLFASIARLAGAGGLDVADMFGGGEVGWKGMSKLVSAMRTNASQLWDQSNAQVNQANSIARGAGGVTDETGLRSLGTALQDAYMSYYNPSGPYGQGPSSYITGATNPEAMKPFNEALSRWKGIDQSLVGRGLPGLNVNPGMAQITGLGGPSNRAELAAGTGVVNYGGDVGGAPWMDPAVSAKYGPEGQAPTNLTDKAGQDWLQNAYRQYTAGVQPWDTSLDKGASPSGFAALGTNSSTSAPTTAGGPIGGSGGKNNLLGTLGFAGLSGPLNEIRGGDNPNQV